MLTILTCMIGGPVWGKTLFLAHYNDANVNVDYAAGQATAAPIAYNEQHGECGLCNQVHSGYQVALTTESGRFGHGLDLTEVSHNITYPAAGNLDPRKGTADLWFLLDDNPAGSYHPLFGWFNPPTQPGNRERKSALYVHIQDTTVTLTTFTPDLVTSLANVDSLSETGTWHHLEINWDCTGGEGQSAYNVYVDGNNVIRLTDAGALAAAGGSIHLGIWDSSWGHFLRGRIDELRITDQVEHEGKFTPPVREYSTPGTPSGVEAAYQQALTDLRSLQTDLDAFSKARLLMQGQIDADQAILSEAGSSLAAEQAGQSLRAIAERIEREKTDWDVVQLQETINEATDSIKTTRHDLVKTLGLVYTHIPDVYNQTIVNLGYLKDEREGLTRAIRYIREMPDEDWTGRNIEMAERVVQEVDQILLDTFTSLEPISDEFHGLFQDSPGDRKDPVAALPALSVVPRNRKVLESLSDRLNKGADVVTRARSTIRATFHRLRTDPVFKAAFPDYRQYIPAELPPVEIAADGTLKRIVFGGNYGRADTVMRLGFDTFPSSIGGVEWTDPDTFTHTVNPEYAAYIGKFGNKSAYIQMTYATGAGMYRPSWFADDYGDDPDFYFAPGIQGGGGFDYRHPVPRAMILEYLEGAAREAANDSRHVMYKGPWEAHPYENVGTFRFREFGTSVPAIAAFRDYLQDEYGTIGELNTAWGTSYVDYDAIDPPARLIMGYHENVDERGRGVYFPYWPVKRLPATPLTYWFERCRKDLYAEYLADCHQAIKRGDPNRPLASSTSGGIYDEIMVNSLDDLQMPDTGVDMWGKHPSGGIGWHDSPYMWGLNRYFNKTLVSLEYYGYGFEEFQPGYGASFLAQGSTGESAYNAMRRDIWHDTSWDRRMLDFYWPSRFTEFRVAPGDNWLSDGINPFKAPILTPWAGVIPVVKRRALNINDILINTPIIEPKITILHAGVSIINAYPTDGSRYAVADAMDRLLAMQYHFNFVAEEFVLNDPSDRRVHHDSLDGYDVVILPYVQYFDDGFAARLLNWVSDGGTLIALGPFGLKDKLGFEISDGAALVYPDATFSYTDPDYPLSWVWDVSGSPAFTNGYSICSYGSGTVMTTLDGRALYRPVVGIGEGTKETARPPASDIVDPGGYSAAQQAFYDTLAAATERKAWVTAGNVEMVIRQVEDGSGPLYISLLNWDYRHALDTTVKVDGEYTSVTDLSIPSGFPVPVSVEDGMTRFPVLLGPGEGLMLRLQQ